MRARCTTALVLALSLAACSERTPVDHAARAAHWIDAEFQPSTLAM